MKTKLIIISILFLFSSTTVEAQFFKKLKDKANKALGIEKTEENEDADTNAAKGINTDLKKAFYTKDVVLKMYDKGQQTLTYHFDAEEIAMRSDNETDDSKPMFFDSEGYQIAYNTDKESYEKTGLFKSSSMSMMISSQMISVYKIPAAPFYEALETLGKKGVQVGAFNAMAFAFIYKPEHFEVEDSEYTKSTTANTIKFIINDAEYAGSYVLFDTSGRLREIYTKINNDQVQGTSKLVYSYKPTSVKMPYAEEVKMPGQDLFDMGLDPNKNDTENDEPMAAKKNTSVAQNPIKGTADLSLEKSVDNPLLTVSSTKIFTVELKNDGPEDATSVQVLDKLSESYMLQNTTASTGNYNAETGIWDIPLLANGETATLTFEVIVGPDPNNLENTFEIDYMNLAEVIRCDQPDPDSTPNNGVDTDGDNYVIDDDGDEDDGDGQELVGPEIGHETFSDVKMVIQDKRDKQIYFFDFETLAMRLEYHSKKNNPHPLFFDNDGFIYSVVENEEYQKLPFDKFIDMMQKLVPFFSMGAMPEPHFPDGSETYYGMDVSPQKFMILEWAWVYKIENFEHPDFSKATINCRGESNCTKFTVKDGRDKGAYVLFDSKRRLALIDDNKTGTATYTYEPCTVILPEAKEAYMPVELFDVFSKKAKKQKKIKN